MLGHVGGRTAVLPAQRQALEAAQDDEDDRGRDADGLGTGEDADQEGRGAHDHDGHEEGVLAAHQVAQAAEHQRAEGAHQEAGREGEQSEDVARRLVEHRKELHPDDRRERSVEVEVVPLEHCAEGGRDDDLALLLRHRRRCRLGCHVSCLPYFTVAAAAVASPGVPARSSCGDAVIAHRSRNDQLARGCESVHAATWARDSLARDADAGFAPKPLPSRGSHGGGPMGRNAVAWRAIMWRRCRRFSGDTASPRGGLIGEIP